MINGENATSHLTAPKNGFFYILDAKNRQACSPPKQLVKTTWASAYDFQSSQTSFDPPRRRAAADSGRSTTGGP